MRGRRWVAILLGMALVGLLAVCYSGALLPRELPWLLQLALSVGFTALAVWTYAVATRPPESPDDALLRLRRVHSSDFGKQLRQNRPKPRTFSLPLLGETTVRAIGGAALGIGVFAWWLTPWAPVRMRQEKIDDLTIPLGEQISAVVLIMPKWDMPLVEPPSPSPVARKLAKLIYDKSSPDLLALRAVAENRHDDARQLLAQCESEGIDAKRLLLIRAQNETLAGRYDEAIKLYEKLAESEEMPVGTLAQATAAALIAGQTAKAAKLVALAEKEAGEHLKPGDPGRAPVLHLKAVVLACESKDYGKPQELCLQARQLLRDAGRTDAPLVAASLNNQAVFYSVNGNFPGAVNLLLEAKELWKKTYGENAPITLEKTAAGNLGVIELASGHFSKAESLLAGIRAQREDREESNLARAVSLSALGALYTQLSKAEDARAKADMGLALAERELGPEHPAVPALRLIAARAYRRMGYYNAEERHLDRALVRSRKVWGPDHPVTAAMLLDLADFNLRQQRFDEGLSALKQAETIYKRAFGREHWGVAAVLSCRGRILIKQDKPHEARPALSEALKLQEKVFGKDQPHPEIARTLGALAALSTSPQTYAAGVRQFKKAQAMAEELFGHDHPAVAAPLKGAAELHIGREKYAEAENDIKEALDIYEKSLPQTHPDIIKTLETYASLLRRFDPPKVQQAAALEQRAKDLRDKLATLDRPE